MPVTNRKCLQCGATKSIWWKIVDGGYICNPCYKHNWHIKKRGPLKRIPMTPERKKIRRKENVHRHYVKNRDKILAYQCGRKQLKSEYDKKYRNNNRTQLQQYFHEHYIMNREQKRLYDKRRSEQRIQEMKDSGEYYCRIEKIMYCKEQQAIRKDFRARFYIAIVRNSTRGLIVQLLGKTIPEFKAYIAAQFKPGMSWDNWNKWTWHLDHIKALSTFDLRQFEQLTQAFHYINFQPLWASDNLKKRNKDV